MGANQVKGLAEALKVINLEIKCVPLPLKTAPPLSAAIAMCAQILSLVKFHLQDYAVKHFKLNSQDLFPF